MDNVKTLEKIVKQKDKFYSEISKVIVGQNDVVEHVFIALLCKGHILLEGVPGLGKTLIIKTISDILDLDFNRIQFTPDLMPSDITGTEIISQDAETGERTEIGVSEDPVEESTTTKSIMGYLVTGSPDHLVRFNNEIIFWVFHLYILNSC